MTNRSKLRKINEITIAVIKSFGNNPLNCEEPPFISQQKTCSLIPMQKTLTVFDVILGTGIRKIYSKRLLKIKYKKILSVSIKKEIMKKMGFAKRN